MILGSDLELYSEIQLSSYIVFVFISSKFGHWRFYKTCSHKIAPEHSRLMKFQVLCNQTINLTLKSSKKDVVFN